MTLAIVLAIATISSGLASTRPARPYDPPMIVVSAPASTHGAISGLRSGSVPSATRSHSHATTVIRRTVRS
jgi:hypothetical protein